MAIIAGFGMLGAYAHTPGESGEVPMRLTGDLRDRVGADGVAVVVSLHPKCPCSRASVSELAQTLEAAGLRATALVASYDGVDGEGTATDLAARLGCFDLLDDPGGDLAASLGGLTSGHVLVYDGEGRLRFSGGVTASRGHEGASDERALLERVLSTIAEDRDGIIGENDGVVRTPVYGCPLSGV